jgi:hypothetical protein
MSSSRINLSFLNTKHRVLEIDLRYDMMLRDHLNSFLCIAIPSCMRLVTGQHLVTPGERHVSRMLGLIPEMGYASLGATRDEMHDKVSRGCSFERHHATQSIPLDNLNG